MPWIFVVDEYTGPRKTCPVCRGAGQFEFSNPPSPRDACDWCDGLGYIPCEDEPMSEVDAVKAEEGEG